MTAYTMLNKGAVPNAKIHRAVNREAADSAGRVEARLLPACGVRVDWTALEYEHTDRKPSLVGELCGRCFPERLTVAQESENR